MNIKGLSGMESSTCRVKSAMALSAVEGGGATKAERVGRLEPLWVVGAVEGDGGG